MPATCFLHLIFKNAKVVARFENGISDINKNRDNLIDTYSRKFGEEIYGFTRWPYLKYHTDDAVEIFLRRQNAPTIEITDFDKEPEFPAPTEKYAIIVGKNIIVKRLTVKEIKELLPFDEEYASEYMYEKYHTDVESVVIVDNLPKMTLRSGGNKVVKSLIFDEDDKTKAEAGAIKKELSGKRKRSTPDWLYFYTDSNKIKLKFTERMKDLFSRRYRAVRTSDEGAKEFAEDYAKLLNINFEDTDYEFLYGEDVEEIRVGW